MERSSIEVLNHRLTELREQGAVAADVERARSAFELTAEHGEATLVGAVRDHVQARAAAEQARAWLRECVIAAGRTGSVNITRLSEQTGISRPTLTGWVRRGA